MRHVWILNHYAQAPGDGWSTRHFSLARHLPVSGWRATIIAASTDHSTGRQRLPERQQSRLEIDEGVSFLWVRTPEYHDNGGARLRNMAAYTWAVLQRETLLGLDAPDLIVGSSVHPLAAWAGRHLARRFDVPFIFEVRDLWPQTLIDMGRISSRHPAAIVLRWLEKSLYRSASRIIVLMPKAGDYIEPLGVARNKIVWIPNGVDLDRFCATPAREAAGSFTLMYLGAHGTANGLDNLIDAMRIVQNSHRGHRIILRMIGDGPLKASLVKMARGLDNVRFEDPVAKSAIPELAAEADAFVICVRNLPGLYRFGISMNKIFDYMAARRPTIISSDASNNPLAEANCGITVPPDNPKALATAILDVSSLCRSRRDEMGAASRKHVEDNYSMEVLAKRLASTLNDCLNAR
jgi:glycosyltransferase involved in cell wall biosynthesis